MKLSLYELVDITIGGEILQYLKRVKSIKWGDNSEGYEQGRISTQFDSAAHCYEVIQALLDKERDNDNFYFYGINRESTYVLLPEITFT